MKRIGRKIILASVCFCMIAWAAMPCLVFGAESDWGTSSKVGPATIKPGETITYEIKATKLNTITNFNIRDSVSNYLENVECTAKINTGSEDTPTPVIEVKGNEVFVKVMYDDEAFVYQDDEVIVTVTAKVKADVPADTVITNTARFMRSDEELTTESCNTTVAANPPAPAPDNPEDTPKDTPVEYDDDPDCGDHFLNFWWLLDIIRTWI